MTATADDEVERNQLERRVAHLQAKLARVAALPQAIRALPFTPDTHTGTRQAAMREAAAKLVEAALAGKES